MTSSRRSISSRLARSAGLRMPWLGARARRAVKSAARPRRRGNRRREAPVWRRLPELVRALPGLLRVWLRRSLPASIALGVSAALIAGVCGGYYFLTRSDRFAIRTIVVRGNHTLSTDAITALLGVHIGDNIFGVRLGELEWRLTQSPWLARAEIRRGLPDALLVDVDENHPAALVELGGLYLADEHGAVFKRATIERGDGVGLPIITGLSRAEYIARPDSVKQAIRDALAAAALYSQNQDRPALGEIHVDLRRGITVLGHENALAIELGTSEPGLLDAHLHMFDRVWQSLDASERARARAIYANDSSPSGRVTVAFADIE